MFYLIKKITARSEKMQKVLKEALLFVRVVSSMDEIQQRDGWGKAIETASQKFPEKDFSLSALGELRRSFNEAYLEVIGLLDEAERILKSKKKY